MATGAIRGMVEGELSHRGRFMLNVPVQQGGGMLPYFRVEGRGAPTPEVWVESNPKYGPQRRAIIDSVGMIMPNSADRGSLGTAWVRQPATWQALRVAHPAGGRLTRVR